MSNKIIILIPVLLLSLLLSNNSCYKDLGGFFIPGSKPVEDHDGTVISSHGPCYLKDLGNGKKLLHLEGSAYDRGYAMGYLLPNEVRRITSMEYIRAVIDGMTDGSLSQIYDTWIEEFAVNAIKLLTDVKMSAVPAEYITEMKGVVAGVNDATPDAAKLKFDDVLLLNMGSDVIYSFLYEIDYLQSLSSCNGFVVTGNATADGRTLMGRHFMYPPEVFNETALVIEYKPNCGHPFVSIGAPGFVGVTSAMNSKGIAIGTEVLYSGDACYGKVGMGTLLLMRKAIQYSDTLEAVVDTMQKATRGVPWMYIVGDGSGKGAVIESTTNHFAVRYLDSVYPDQIEEKDDVVATTNHAIVPEIAATHLPSPFASSRRRYTEITNLILENYGAIDVAKGREIIDFLHPGGAYSWYYGTDQDQPVACSVSLYDLTAKEVWTLFGKYSDQWVHYKLPY
jgi:predicted choloylglycine hydrolase